MKQTVLLLGLGLVTACATPGINYAARVVPPNTAAVETRTVDVGRFSGPGGNWYEGRFEAMLATATLDGEPWFRMARYSDGGLPDGQRAGIYEGLIDITEYQAEEYTQTVSKCVEWDGIFDCEHREDVEEICLREAVEVAVTPRLVEYGSGEVLFSGTYYGSSSNTSCDEVYRRGRRGKHSGGYVSYGFSGGVQPPHDMVIEALSDTIYQVRNDIAPRNTTLKAEFVEEALDPIVRADPRFRQAVKAGLDAPNASCMTWRDLHGEYPASPAVTHNLGACYESAGDYLGAHTLYAEAAQQSAGLTGTGTPDGAFNKALARMSSYRSGLELLNRLTGDTGGDWRAVPQDDELAGAGAGS